MLNKIYNFFSSARLTVFLFFALAATSIVGTLIQQGMPLERYEKTFSHNVFSVLKYLDIFDMYHSWWFTLLLLLLAINLTACTIRQIPRIVSLISRGKGEIDDSIFASSQIRKTWNSRMELSALEQQATSLLESLAGTPVMVKKNNACYFFAERGKYSRLGMLFIHISILFILGGGMIGTIWGFSGQMNLVEGKMSDTVFLFSGKGAEKLGFDVFCDNFTVDYYETGMPKEFRTDVTFIEGGEKVFAGAIRVNHPLIYKGLKFCQATYDVAERSNFKVGVKNSITENETVLPMSMMKKTPLPGSTSSFALARFIPNHNGEGPAVLGVLLEPGKEHDIFWILKNRGTQKGDLVFTLNGFDTLYYTGIQISKDPGIGLVWAGFLLIITGFILSLFFVHTRMWLRISNVQEGYEISVAANVSKNKKAFKEKLDNLIVTFQQSEIQ